jgi:hypothetical protein
MFAPPSAELDQLTDRDITIQDFLAYWIDIQKRLRLELPEVTVVETEADEIVLPDRPVSRAHTTHGFGLVFYSPTRGTRVLDGVVTPEECLQAAHAYFDRHSSKSTADEPSATANASGTSHPARPLAPSDAPPSETPSPIVGPGEDVRLTGTVTSIDASQSRFLIAGDDGRPTQAHSSARGHYIGFAGVIEGRTEIISGDTGLARMRVRDRVEIHGRNLSDGNVVANEVVLLGRPVPPPLHARKGGDSGCTNFRDSGVLPFAKKYYLSIELFGIDRERVIEAISKRRRFSHNIQILSVDARRGSARARSDMVPGAAKADIGRDYPITFVTESTPDATKLSMELDLLWGQFCTNGSAEQMMCDTLQAVASDVAPFAGAVSSNAAGPDERVAKSTPQSGRSEKQDGSRYHGFRQWTNGDRPH